MQWQFERDCGTASGRESGRSQWHEVRFSDEAGNLYTWVVNESAWCTFAIGDIHHLEVNNFGFVYQVLD